MPEVEIEVMAPLAPTGMGGWALAPGVHFAQGILGITTNSERIMVAYGVDGLPVEASAVGPFVVGLDDGFAKDLNATWHVGVSAGLTTASIFLAKTPRGSAYKAAVAPNTPGGWPASCAIMLRGVIRYVVPDPVP